MYPISIVMIDIRWMLSYVQYDVLLPSDMLCLAWESVLSNEE